MKRTVLFLMLGIFLMSGICLAADNRAAMGPEANPALVAEVETAIKALPAGAATDAIIAKLQGLKAGKSTADQASLDLAINSLHRNWVGVNYSAAAVATVSANAKNVAATALPVSAEDMQMITARIGRPVANVPQVKVLPQDQMVGIMGPMYLVAENVVVIGNRDYGIYTNPDAPLHSVWIHEATETIAAANGLTKDDAHNLAEAVEGEVRARGVTAGNQAEIIAQTATGDAQRMVNALQGLPEGAKVRIKTRRDLTGRADLREGLNVIRNMVGDANVTVNSSLPEDGSMGLFQVEITDAKGNPINQCRIDATGELYRLNGLLTEGLIAASIPAIQTGENATAYTQAWQPRVQMLQEQHKANTNGQELAIPADPNQWPAVISRINIVLPVPTAVNINVKMDEGVSAQIFGKMA